MFSLVSIIKRKCILVLVEYLKRYLVYSDNFIIFSYENFQSYAFMYLHWDYQ
jgi:hypothetical protein